MNIVEEDVKNILSDSKINFDLYKNKRVLVTGANGFIGSYIVEVLLHLQDVKVYALGRNSEKLSNRFSAYSGCKNLKLVCQDVCEPLAITDDIDLIIHAASQASPKYYGVDPVGTLKANSLGTMNLLEFAVSHHTKKFIFISSGEIYGPLSGAEDLVSENSPSYIDITDVRSCYAESKRIGETMCSSYSYQYGIQTSSLRLCHTYGPGILLNDGRVFADFVKNIVCNEDIKLNSDGLAKRNFLYITDMIRALFYVMQYGQDRQSYNISSDKETSIIELANLLVSLYPEKNLKVLVNNKSNNKGYIRSSSSRANFDNTKLKSLGWLQQVSLSDGFQRMVRSYLS